LHHLQMDAQTLETLKFRVVKSADIAYLTLLYFVFGAAISMPLDRAFGTFDPVKADKKNVMLLMFEIFAHVAMLGVIVYIVRNVVERIPSPFEGVAGLQHKKLKELGNAAIFVFFLFFYQKYLIDKMNYVYKRLTGQRRY
jgi:hypothetical protein